MDEPKILQDVEHTWTVNDWRTLTRREHGPVFQAGGFPWYVCSSLSRMARGIYLANKTLYSATGAFYSSHMATTLINAQYTSSTASTPTLSPTIGVAASSSHSFCGIPTTPRYMLTMPPTIDSLRKKATGDSLDSSSYGACSTFHGKAAAVPCVRTIPPTLPLTCDSSRTRRVSCGTTLPTTTPKQKLDMSDLRTKAPPAISILFYSHCTLPMPSERYAQPRFVLTHRIH